MTLLLWIGVSVVALAVIGATLELVWYRHRQAEVAAARAAATPVPELDDADIAWRLRVERVARASGTRVAPAPARVVPADLPDARPREPEPSDASARRYRLWQDTAVALLVTCVAILAATSFHPTLGTGPSAGAVAGATGRPVVLAPSPAWSPAASATATPAPAGSRSP